MKKKLKKAHNKWKSRRWIITVWAMFMGTAIVILGIIFENDSYTMLATTLVAIPVGFVSLEKTYKKDRGINKKNFVTPQLLFEGSFFYTFNF